MADSLVPPAPLADPDVAWLRRLADTLRSLKSVDAADDLEDVAKRIARRFAALEADAKDAARWRAVRWRYHMIDGQADDAIDAARLAGPGETQPKETTE